MKLMMTKEELEKEADEYADKHAFRVPYDGSNNFYDGVDFKASKEGYLAGAEPREKRISDLEDKLVKKVTLESLKIVSAREKELEEKNRELRDRLCNVANNLLDSWCRNEEDYCPHLAKLEKENAELKARLNAINLLTPELEKMSKLKNQQLTKATEVIEGLMRFCRCFAQHHTEDIRYKDAEQFLKEVKEK